MTPNRVLIAIASIALAAAAASGQTRRSAYTYVREVSGEVTVISPLNGTVEARRNLPISAGDEIRTDDPSRAEIALADGNVLHVGGGTSVQLVSLSNQQGADDEVSAISLKEGSVVLSALGSDEKAVPRVDTEDVTVYANAGSRVRVNADPRRGSAVIVRAGSVEVKSPTGSYTVRAGNYLLSQGNEEPEIARGSFSRDRFDVWAADRLSATYDAPQNASSQYVGEDYSGDVASLDGYGDWDYNTNYSTYVWRPNVAAGWSPYTNGSWYYTPAGMSWWSWDPWGWYPFHYGNWFFDSGWNSWCWAPGYVYSPAWVYWGYAPGYVGWCPVGWYGYYSPWWNTYYRQWSYPRSNICFAFNGNFSTRHVDMRGWNFTGSNGFGTTRGRVDAVPGTRVVDRLGGQIAVSSRPIVLASRNGTSVRDSLRDYVQNAPRNIQRTSDPDLQRRLEPVLARQRELPRESVDALRDRVAISERGRLSGPGAADIAPRGAPVVERGRGAVSVESSTRIETDPATGRTVVRGGSGGSTRGTSGAEGFNNRGPAATTTDSRNDPAVQSWRSRPNVGVSSNRPADNAPQAPEGSSTAGRESREHWRTRPNPVPGSRSYADSANVDADRGGSRSRDAQRSASTARTDDWRHRDGSMPPARRVIEGSVPGRRTPYPGSQNGDSGSARSSVPREHGRRPPTGDFATHDGGPPSSVPRDVAPAPRQAAPSAHPVPAPPSHAAPAPHAAPPPSSGGGGHRPPGR